MTQFSHITRDDLATLVEMARNLIAAHERRNATSEHPTLSEEDALFSLSWKLNSLKAESGRVA